MNIHKDEKFSAWHPDHIRLDLIRGDLSKVGSIIYFEEYLGKNKHKLRLMCQLTKRKENSYLEFHLPYPLRFLLPGNGGIQLEEKEKGTRVKIFVNYGIPLPVLNEITDKVIEKFFVKADDIVSHTKEEMEILKDLLEETPQKAS